MAALRRAACQLQLLTAIIIMSSLWSTVASFQPITKRRHVLSWSKRFCATTTEPSLLRPQAAVSVGVRCRIRQDDNDANNHARQNYYLMIQRGKEPNKGKWSIPGGRLQFGETALECGVRELSEETKWNDAQQFRSLRWYAGTVCTSDYVDEKVHYLIAQCFAELECDTHHNLPVIRADDDADDARWFLLPQVKEWTDQGMVSEGVYEVFCRMETLANNGLLPTTEPLTDDS